MLRSTLALLLAAAPAVAEVSFNRDVRPVLADACFHCHGPDPGTREAGLRLDTEAGFFDPASGPTVVAGDPEKSPLYQRLVTQDPDDIMPPPDSHKELDASQIELIRQWIADGAQWQPHWSLIPPARPDLPAPAKAEWIQNPIDAFVLKQLEEAGLQPAAPADRFELGRRLSLDVVGLPPSPEDLKAFVKDDQPGAIDRYLDRLFASPQYGEHRARYWLDAARYGDTHGLHFDNYREMWPYRDWVVKAFNRNLPFDDFTIEQLAGDLLPDPSREQLIATGFQRCNITTNEGGTIDEENLANYAADRVQTLGWVYMGLTTNCAQCHDHKFDPISLQDYYSLAAFFRNTTQGPKDGNAKDGKGPVLVIPSEEDATRWDALPQEIAQVETDRQQRRKTARPGFEKWITEASPETLASDMPSKGLAVHLALNEGSGDTVHGTCGERTTIRATGPVKWTPDGKLGPAPILKLKGTFDLGNEGDFEQDQPFSYGAWIKAGRNGLHGGVIAKMDEKSGYRGWDLWIQDRSLAVHIISQWPQDAVKVATRNAVVTPGKWQHVFVTYDGSGKAAGVKLYVNGVNQRMLVNQNTLKKESSIRTPTPLRLGQRSHVQVFDGGSLQDVRIYNRAVTPAEVKKIQEVGPLLGMLAAKEESRTPAQREALYGHFLATRDDRYRNLQTKLNTLNKEKNDIQGRSPLTHIQQEKADSPAMANILMRGQYDQVGEEVTAEVPVSMGRLPKDYSRDRLGLAKWLVHESNPLTARVTVNRLWQELFGTGLVATSEDFGIMGTPPSHPQLLDWLAVEFRESGWNVKALLRLMLTSATYQQQSLWTEEKSLKDRDNRLLSRGPRFRMDAEMVRDYALAASGTLSTRMGGPGTRPYQPDDIWNVVGLRSGDTREYVQDTGENLYRRTIYNFWKRMAHSPNMEIFNAPSREVCTVRRERTNTPLQALVGLNDIQFVEAARRMAEAGMSRDPKVGPMLDDLTMRTLCRPIRKEEREILTKSYHRLLKHYQEHPADAKELIQYGDTPASGLPPAQLAAWTMVCNQLLNLDEVLNK